MINDKKDERINVGAGMVPTYHATESVEEARAVVESCRPGTEDLRRMLDERGVEYVANDYKSVKETCWSYMGELDAVFAEFGDGETRFVCDTGCFTPEQAIAATLGGDNSDMVKHLMKLQGGHYSWPMLYEAVTGDPFDYDCPPSKSEEVFIEKLISIVVGRKVVDESE